MIVRLGNFLPWTRILVSNNGIVSEQLNKNMYFLSIYICWLFWDITVQEMFKYANKCKCKNDKRCDEQDEILIF